MLTCLRIKNFQRHKSLTVDLDPCVTTIVGGSDAGKSAVLRALRWVLLNKTSAGFATKGATDTRVQVSFSDGTRATRMRSKTKNSYKLGADVFVAMGTQVPLTISQFLNVAELNFQGQYDAPFWLDLTGGEAAKRLNAVVDLQRLDSVQADIAAKLRRHKVALELAEQAVCESAKAVRRYEDLPACKAEFAHLLEVAKSCDTLRDQSQVYADIIGKIKALRVARPPDASAVLEKAEALAALRKDANTMQELVAKLKAATHTKQSAQSAYAAAIKAQTTQLKGEQCPVCGSLMS